jgi:homoserine dehydrogenase
MSAVLDTFDRTLGSRIPTPRPGAPATAPRLRTITVGLLGLGRVGQAVARLAPAGQRLREHGYRVHIACALVRDIHRPRRCVRPPRLTTNPSAFLRGHYDVVIEALGGIEPARSIVARLLGRGTAVVTANKALVAAHGAELSALAARRGTTLRYEASALAGVPFLGALAHRPFVSAVTAFTAILNGTSNFVLTAIERDGCSIETALASAEAAGLAEPDPSRDVDGIDAADKLTLIAWLLGWGRVPVGRLEIRSIRGVTSDDFAAARALDATIRPVAVASLSDAGLHAFVGPALLPARHPLASVDGTLNGIQLSGRIVPDLFFSGPGAGPDITAATILDDVVEAVSFSPQRREAPARSARAARVAAPPSTEWFLRLRFPGLVPDTEAVRSLVACAGLEAQQVVDGCTAGARWVRTSVAHRSIVDAAIERFRDVHRIEAAAIRALS